MVRASHAKVKHCRCGCRTIGGQQRVKGKDEILGPHTLDRAHGSPARRTRTSKPAPPGQPPAGARRHEPSFSGDDLVLWQVLRISPSSWRSIRYTGLTRGLLVGATGFEPVTSAV
jgi:hypothetical protein